MASILNALNKYLEYLLLISTLAARQAINVQGVEASNDFMTLTEENMSDICSYVRKPGGVLPNPMHNPQNGMAGIPPTIPSNANRMPIDSGLCNIGADHSSVPPQRTRG